jgi:hypothetical protein
VWEQFPDIYNETIGIAVLRAGGETGQLPIARYEGTPITLSRFQELVTFRSEVTLMFSSAELAEWPQGRPKPILIDPRIRVVDHGEIEKLFRRIIAAAWEVRLEQVSSILQMRREHFGGTPELIFRRLSSSPGTISLH